MKNKYLWVARCASSLESVEAYVEVFEKTAQTVSWYVDAETQNWAIEALYPTHPFVDDIRASLEKRAQSLQEPPPRVTFKILPAQDWLAENFRSFPPLTLGCFYLYGTHHTGAVPVGKIGLHLDAATAFGSGRHETTAGCLAALQEIADTHPWRKPLDLGCGSGILALAMALLRPNIPVFAYDCDPEAVRVTQENCVLNQVSGRVHVGQSDGFSAVDLQKNKPYDLIVANILAEPLKNMVSEMRSALEKEGHVILSGILATQAADVVLIYEKSGFSLVQEKILGEWSTLMLKGP